MVGSSAHAQDTLTLSCPVCHGQRTSPAQIPGLYGSTSAEIAEALRGFRSGARDGTAMPRLAVPLSDEDIRRIADFYGEPAP